MDILNEIRVKAANWVNTSQIIEGSLQVADKVTLYPADKETIGNGYVLVIVDDLKIRHVICPDTLQVIGLNENSETAKAVFDVTMKMASAGFTIAETETFWKDCVTSAELMIESKKRGITQLYYIQNRDAGYLGNSIFFWNKDSNSYTSKLEYSKKFTYEEAKSICNNSGSKYIAWPCDYIDKNIGTCKVTDSQYLDKKNIVKF